MSKNVRLFQYVIIFTPSDKEEKDGVKAKVLVDVTNALSQDEKSVAILAARQIPEEYLDKLDQVNIAIRPF